MYLLPTIIFSYRVLDIASYFIQELLVKEPVVHELATPVLCVCVCVCVLPSDVSGAWRWYFQSNKSCDGTVFNSNVTQVIVFPILGRGEGIE